MASKIFAPASDVRAWGAANGYPDEATEGKRGRLAKPLVEDYNKSKEGKRRPYAPGAAVEPVKVGRKTLRVRPSEVRAEAARLGHDVKGKGRLKTEVRAEALASLAK